MCKWRAPRRRCRQVVLGGRLLQVSSLRAGGVVSELEATFAVLHCISCFVQKRGVGAAFSYQPLWAPAEVPRGSPGRGQYRDRGPPELHQGVGQSVHFWYCRVPEIPTGLPDKHGRWGHVARGYLRCRRFSESSFRPDLPAGAASSVPSDQLYVPSHGVLVCP